MQKYKSKHDSPQIFLLCGEWILFVKFAIDNIAAKMLCPVILLLMRVPLLQRFISIHSWYFTVFETPLLWVIFRPELVFLREAP